MTKKEIMELVSLALDVNGLGERKGKTSNLPTVFIYFSGHTADIDINVHEHGWLKMTEPDRKFTMHTDMEASTELEECMDYLKALKEKCPGADQSNPGHK